MPDFFQNTRARRPSRNTGVVHWTDERLRELAAELRKDSGVDSVAITLQKRWKTPVPPGSIRARMSEAGGGERLLAAYP